MGKLARLVGDYTVGLLIVAWHVALLAREEAQRAHEATA